jgi:hypothetical protein
MNAYNCRRSFPFALALLLGFSACSSTGSAGSSVPTAQTPLAVPAIATTLVAGEYSGTVTDSARKKGTATLQLSQSVFTTGGSLNQKYGTKAVHGVVALSLSGTSLSGNEVTLGPGPCTFSMTAKYDTKTAVLSGSYSAINRCNGESGTFKLTERCYYTIPSASDIERPNVIGVRPC